MSATDGNARTGIIETQRGRIRAPAFMPVGTQATVKAMFTEDVAAAGADILAGRQQSEVMSWSNTLVFQEHMERIREAFPG